MVVMWSGADGEVTVVHGPGDYEKEHVAARMAAQAAVGALSSICFCD